MTELHNSIIQECIQVFQYCRIEELQNCRIPVFLNSDRFFESAL